MPRDVHLMRDGRVQDRPAGSLLASNTTHAHERASKSLPLKLAFVAVLAVAAGILVNKFGPEGLLREDGAIEWASATLFAIAALLAALSLRGRDGFDWLALYVILLGTLCCLSELAFGARLFGWDMPDMRGGGELDGAHDLVLVAWRTVSENPLVLAAAAVTVLLTLIAALWSARRAGLSPRAIYLWLTSDSRRMLIAAASLGLAVALACDLLEQPRLRQVEEPLELLAACLLVISQRTARLSGDPR
jgi:hypothetical protein